MTHPLPHVGGHSAAQKGVASFRSEHPTGTVYFLSDLPAAGLKDLNNSTAYGTRTPSPQIAI